MQSITKIMLVAAFTQAFAQTAIDKLSERAAQADALADLEATTLAKVLMTAKVPVQNVFMVPPATAHVMPDQRTQPSVAFQIAEAKPLEMKEAKAEEGAPAAGKKPELKKVEITNKWFKAYKPKTFDTYTKNLADSPEWKEILEANKANCFYKNCGGDKTGFVERASVDVSFPAVNSVRPLGGYRHHLCNAQTPWQL